MADPHTVTLTSLDFPAYVMDDTFLALSWNSHVCALYPLIPHPDSRVGPVICPCIELLTIAQGKQMLQTTSSMQVWSEVFQERTLSQPLWSPSTCPQLIDETFTKLRCKTVVHTRMMYDLEVAGGVFRSFELTFSPIEDSQLILVAQNDVTVRVMQNFALFRLIDLNMGLLAQVYPSRFIHDILGAGERRNSLSFSPDDCKKYCENHDSVVILFADIVGFTHLCKSMQPMQIMDLLTSLYESNDRTINLFPNLSKLEIVGDCYVAVGGLMKRETVPDVTSIAVASEMLEFGLALHDIAKSIESPEPLYLRVGIHCGPVTSGIIGRSSCKFMLFGDAMNTASRMESTCPSGKLQVSSEFHELVADTPCWTRTDGVIIKGKGETVTYIHDCLKQPMAVGCEHVTRRTEDVPLDSLEQYPYQSRSDETHRPTWKVNLDMMLPTDTSV